ncbi:TPA: Mov34/MPN/PAD-1 family protein [Pseudomonas aeruginosa]|nr:Mov34/MPN/PAD-1 family protein [Pseudomonas aeruginosa]
MSGREWLWRWPSLEVSLKVGPSAARIFDESRQLSHPRERGGQLFADLSAADGIALVVTPPHPADGSGLTWLELDEQRCRREIAEANAQGLRLIGYWHTHPEPVPSPSAKDIASFRAFAAHYQHELPCPVAVIVGTAMVANGIRAWSVRPDGLWEATVVSL